MVFSFAWRAGWEMPSVGRKELRELGEKKNGCRYCRNQIVRRRPLFWFIPTQGGWIDCSALPFISHLRLGTRWWQRFRFFFFFCLDFSSLGACGGLMFRPAMGVVVRVAPLTFKRGQNVAWPVVGGFWQDLFVFFFFRGFCQHALFGCVCRAATGDATVLMLLL